MCAIFKKYCNFNYLPFGQWGPDSYKKREKTTNLTISITFFT